MTSSTDKINQWVRPELRALQAYHVPEAGDLIKLDAMENPYCWPQWLVDAWLEELRGTTLSRYPDPAAGALKARLRAVLDVPGDCRTVLGNGSDELIQMIIQTVASPGRVIMAPEPTFVMYRQLAVVTGLVWSGVPLLEDFSIDADAMIDAIETQQPAVVFLAYPNNPTGNLFDRAVIEAILSQAPGLVVVDEAYAPFTDESFMCQLPVYDNLLVLRTLSKMGFAGLRLGLLAGASDWLAEIEKTRLPYNISTLNQQTGEFALGHYEVFAGQANTLRSHRDALSEQLTRVPGLTVYPSEANFILFRVPQGQGPAIHEGLKTCGILIKNLDGSAPALSDCLRVTVGKSEENAAFIEALNEVITR